MSGLGFGQGMQLKLGQDMKLAPRMIMSMKVLLMPITDLLEKVQTELQENPFLEQKEKTTDHHDSDKPGTDGVLKHDETGDVEFARLDEMNKDWEDHFNDDHRMSRSGIDELGDRKLEVMQNLEESPQTLQEHLVEQLGIQALEPELHDLVVYVISHLDENGYLLGHEENGRVQPVTSEELAANYTDRVVTGEDIDEAIEIIQDLEPLGVGARDVRECLLLQVTNETPHAELVRTMLRNHMEDVAYNRLPVVQKSTGFEMETIQEAVDEIRRLDPKPGAKFTKQNTQYVVPDIIVERNDAGDYTIRLTDDWLPTIRLNKQYIGITKDRAQPKTVRDDLKKKLQSANWLLAAIEQRRHTLKRVTEEVLKHQRAFFDLGPDHIQPLKMEQIAERVGVHVTTVSRAVDDKWMQTPRGLFALRRFFGGGTKSADGQDIAWETIKNKMLEIIAAEDKKKPLSDEHIVDKFTEAGLTIARRTVTKYREALKIPSSRQRRDWVASGP